MDSQNISLNNPVRSKAFTSRATPDVKRYKAPDEEATLKRPFSSQSTLELYGGSGQIRTEQPAVRGRNIDITV